MLCHQPAIPKDFDTACRVTFGICSVKSSEVIFKLVVPVICMSYSGSDHGKLASYTKKPKSIGVVSC